MEAEEKQGVGEKSLQPRDTPVCVLLANLPLDTELDELTDSLLPELANHQIQSVSQM